MFIHWEDDLKIDIASIDLEHRMMVMLIKKLDQAIKSGVSKPLLVRIILELKEFTRFHFVSEENLMLEIDYPEFLEHEQVHSQLLSQIDLLASRINHGLDNPEDSMAFIWLWLEGHIEHHDKDLGKYMQRQQKVTLTQSSFDTIFRVQQVGGRDYAKTE